MTRLTADQFTIRTASGEKHFTRETVRQVARRHRPIRPGVLIGAGVGVAAGAVAACTGPSREECVDGPIMAGALGAGLGLAVAAPIHRTTIVYPEPPAKAASVSTQLPPGGVGIRVNLRW